MRRFWLFLAVVFFCLTNVAPVFSEPIKHFTIQAIGRAGPLPVPGYHFSSVDLNSGVGGDYIYCGWKRESTNAITHIRIKTYSEQQTSNPYGSDGWDWNPTDLNRGAGGRWIYLFWKHVDGYKPLQNVTFLVTGLSSPPPIPDYKSIPVDLNMGSNGPYIFMYASFEDSRSADEPAKQVEIRGDNKIIISHRGADQDVELSQSLTEPNRRRRRGSEQ